jgi:uncharacterized damage-inducible protein DinB
MTRTNKLSKELNNSIFGDPWHGASAVAILNGISVHQAIQRPITSAHSIIELILHLTAWTEEILRRFNGNNPSEPQMGDWPSPENYSDEYWTSVKQNLYDATNKLISAIQGFPEEMLDKIIGRERNISLGTGFSFEGLIMGLVQHNAYHLGQISLLKKSFLN